MQRHMISGAKFSEQPVTRWEPSRISMGDGCCLTSSLTTWVMGHSAHPVSLHRILNWGERSICWKVELLLRGMLTG